MPSEETPAWHAEQARLRVGHEWLARIRAQLRGELVLSPEPNDEDEEPF